LIAKNIDNLELAVQEIERAVEINSIVLQHQKLSINAVENKDPVKSRDFSPRFFSFHISHSHHISALIDSGATVNVINTSVFNKLPNYIKRRMSNICPNLSSVTGYDLDVKGTVNLALGKDNTNFYPRFIVCKNFPYEAIIGANFLKSYKILLDVANSKFIYPKGHHINNE